MKALGSKRVILVDFREDSAKKGSNGLWDDLKKTDIELMQGTLEGGDLFFLGKGPEGREVTVGVEFKKLSDLLSSLRSKRLQGHQLFEMQPYDFRFLLIEGEWRHDDEGFVTIRSFRKGQKPSWRRAPGSFRAAELDKSLLGLVLRAGVIVKETHSRKDTVRWIQSLYRNFTDMEWDDHTSHTGLYRPSSGFQRPSPFRDFIAGIPGVGIKRSKTVEQFFWNPTKGKASPRRAVAARADTWAQIDGIGKKGAEQIDAFLEGE
jgi:ERCC4-type nuclease